MSSSSDRFYRIQNHDDGYFHYLEKIRQYRYQLVNGVDEEGFYIYGLFRYSGAPDFVHQGFYHVKDADLSEAWWKKPSMAQRAELLTRYPDAVF